MKPAISVRGLAKSYYFGGGKRVTDLRETVAMLLKGKRRPATVDGPGSIFWALDDVSFDVAPGEVMGVIGRNGAGKSTLFKILSRITEPTRGRAEIWGRMGTLLEVGTGFHPDLSGRENIYLSGAVLGMRIAEIQSCFNEIVEFSGVAKFIDTPVKFYSSGMYVRLAFSVAAHLRTDVLLLDEVLAVGDYEFQRKCLNRMQAIRDEGRTIVFVSHNMASITAVCQKAILLDKGGLLAVGPSHQVVQQFLQTSASSAAEVTWDGVKSKAPGTSDFALKSIRVRQKGQEGQGRADLDLISPVEIEIEYDVLEDDVPLLCGIRVKDINSSTVLTSTNHESLTQERDELANRPRKKGHYRTVCELPANFLNDGLYSISVMFLKPFFKVELNLEDVLTFFLHDTGELRKHYLGPWAGSVRPRLDWATANLSERYGNKPVLVANR